MIAVIPGAGWLPAAVFLLRQTGQGLASHTGVVAVARHFGPERGKALALAALGYAAGQSVLPFLAVLGIEAWGWRTTYGVCAGVLAVSLLPAVRLLLRGHEDAHLRPAAGFGGVGESGGAGAETGPEPALLSAPASRVLRDWRFYMILPAVTAPSFISTAMFFHHPALAAAKGWNLAWLTGYYGLHAAGAVLVSMLSGALVDRFTARRVLPLFLAPLAAALWIIARFDDPFWAAPYLLLSGVTSGIAFTALAAFWAEAYGIARLGAVKAAATAAQVLFSALGPAAVGWAMDAGFSIESAALMMAAYCAAATALLCAGLYAYGRA